MAEMHKPFAEAFAAASLSRILFRLRIKMASMVAGQHVECKHDCRASTRFGQHTDIRALPQRCRATQMLVAAGGSAANPATRAVMAHANVEFLNHSEMLSSVH